MKILIIMTILCTLLTLGHTEPSSTQKGLFANLFGPNAETKTSIHIDLPISAPLSGDFEDNYIGNSNTAVGMGAQSLVLYPVFPNLRLGGNFHYSSYGYQGDVYYLDVYNMSIGPVLEIIINEIPITTFANYNIGWADAEVEEAAGNNSVKSTGSFSAGLPGVVIGIKGDIPVTDRVVIAPYLTMEFLTISEFAYMRYVSSSWNKRWTSDSFTSIHIGCSLYLDKFFGS